MASTSDWIIELEEHPYLDPRAIHVELAAAQGARSPDWLQQMLTPVAAPEIDDEVKKTVRQLLRHGGYRPAGRGKPSSEWLLRSASDGKLSSIYPLVDIGNAASLAAGIPLSVVDLDRVEAPLGISLGLPGQKYVFNRSGQEIDLAGLLCLTDRTGACANAVKDSQRSKTDESTRRAMFIIWGTHQLPGSAQRLADRIRGLVERLGGDSLAVEFGSSGGTESLQSTAENL
ncbi:MAG: phenylalanine--tRNA ligase beta subunit-related protein [Planctomycetota bacterium]|nr:phenylalanine--tRNA ligase beta subunit-related protein [Planctomycetota bacterium]